VGSVAPYLLAVRDPKGKYRSSPEEVWRNATGPAKDDQPFLWQDAPGGSTPKITRFGRTPFPGSHHAEDVRRPPSESSGRELHPEKICRSMSVSEPSIRWGIPWGPDSVGGS
jgi:hypothetical protein